MSAPAIEVSQLSKWYMLEGPAPRTFQETLARLLGASRRGQPLLSLAGISFRVAPGESVALVGRNGAGKSTLLRLICGLGSPSRGSARVNGRVAALLELGAGFHPDLSGRQNLYVSALVSGLRRREVDDRFDEIVRFAELAEFIDQPLRIYSTGMKMRLAFAVAIHVSPNVLIIDEALAVGDYSFQEKCLARIEAFRAQGKTLLLVSHDMETVRRFCDRAIWIDHGHMVMDGPADVVTRAYETDDRSLTGAAVESGATTFSALMAG